MHQVCMPHAPAYETLVFSVTHIHGVVENVCNLDPRMVWRETHHIQSWVLPWTLCILALPSLLTVPLLTLPPSYPVFFSLKFTLWAHSFSSSFASMNHRWIQVCASEYGWVKLHVVECLGVYVYGRVKGVFVCLVYPLIDALAYIFNMFNSMINKWE